MSSPQLDRCGQLLMHEVRDLTIENWNRVLSGRMKDNESQALFNSLEPNIRSIIKEMVPKIVDTCIHYSLSLFETEQGLRLAVQSEAGELTDVAMLSDGLSGELYTENGWIARFSTGTLHDETF